MHDIAMIGHVSNDIIEDPRSTQYVLGGPVVYSSAAAARSGASVLVVTKAADSDREQLGVIQESGAELVVLPSSETTSIHNRYETADHERRTVRLISAASPFAAEELPDSGARIFHLAGLFYGEIPETLIPWAASRGHVALDAQGVVRKRADGGMLASSDWEAKADYLPYIRHFKTDAAEAEMLTGLSDREAAAARLLELGAGEVMVTHHSEVLLVAPDGTYRAPLTPRNLSGRTGRGDTCFAAYLAWQLSHDREEALRYAAALVSIKMESPGVFRGSPEDVFRRLA